MADIRVKNAPKQLIEQLQKMMVEFNEKTIAKTITKMIPRYFDLKKIIEEQREDIATLSQKVRTFEQTESTLKSSFDRHVRFMRGNLNYLTQNHKEAVKMLEKFGTKNKPRKAPATRKAKILSTSKKGK